MSKSKMLGLLLKALLAYVAGGIALVLAWSGIGTFALISEYMLADYIVAVAPSPQFLDPYVSYVRTIVTRDLAVLCGLAAAAGLIWYWKALSTPIFDPNEIPTRLSRWFWGPFVTCWLLLTAWCSYSVFFTPEFHSQVRAPLLVVLVLIYPIICFVVSRSLTPARAVSVLRIGGFRTGTDRQAA